MILKTSKILLVCFLITNDINAQLCQGSLGDPIINITFGQGANPGAPLSAATTSYQYIAADCPADGYYAVRNNTTGCFGNTWHTLSTDHTGDAGGYMMVVNASFQPGAFYLDTVRNLCGSTTYEFAAWIMNLLISSACNGTGIQPNLTFTIEKTDGTLLQSFNSNNIPSSSSPLWKQYGFFFKTPPSVSDVVLRIVNNAPGGCGNDLALDDITFRPCGPVITGSVDGQAITNAAFCEGQQRTFILSSTISGSFTAPAFQWQSFNSSTNTWVDIPLENSKTLIISFPQNASPGIYQYRLGVAESGNILSPQCRVYSSPFTFIINQNPVTTVSNNSPLCKGSSLTLSATGGVTYQWSGPNNFTATGSPLQLNNIQLSQAGKYYVTVTNTAGCSNLDSTFVTVNPVPIATTTFSSVNICARDSIQLKASGGNTYQWTPPGGLSAINISDPKASPASTTTYSVIVSNQFSCKDTAKIIVMLNPKPIANAGPDKIIFKGQSVQLSGSVSGSGIYVWSPATNINDVNALQPLVNPLADINYVLTVVSAFGCGSNSDTVFVKVFNDIFIPNAFSPNGDNLNDVWNIMGLGVCPFYEVSVYSRWGQLVFHTKDTLKGWDGTFKRVIMPPGIYTYLIKTCRSNNVIRGFVTLMR